VTLAAEGFSLVQDVARLLGSDRPPDAIVAQVVGLVRERLGLQVAALWMHEAGAVPWRRVASPDEIPPRRVPSLDELPPAPDRLRFDISPGVERLGVLEVAGGDESVVRALLPVLADILAPFLAAVHLTEDLALEVAARSREIEAQRLFTALVIDSLPVGLYVVDRELRIQMWNRSRELGARGIPRRDVVGRSIFEVLTPASPEAFRAEFERVFATGEPHSAELEVVVGGEARWFRSTKLPMRLHGDEITHVVTIGEDITRWRTMQAQILQSEKLAAVGQLAAGVMHEINNPLATIGACVAALDGRLGEIAGPGVHAFREYLPIIDREVQRCSRIVDGLLDFSRPQGRRKASVDLNAVATEALELLRHHRRYRAVHVVPDLEAPLPPAWANFEQLVQVVLALGLNALDAMEQGGRLTVRTRRQGSLPGMVLLEVEDTGSGIATDARDKIFEPFFTTKPPGRGTGLGLSICYGIVQEHQGRLDVESQPGAGSTFRVQLPLAPQVQGARGQLGEGGA